MAGIKSVILLLRFPEYWDYRCAPLYQASIRNLNTRRLAHILSVLLLWLIVHPEDWKDHPTWREPKGMKKVFLLPANAKQLSNSHPVWGWCSLFQSKFKTGWPNKDKGLSSSGPRAASSPPWQSLLMGQGKWESLHFCNSQVHEILAVFSGGTKYIPNLSLRHFWSPPSKSQNN